MLIALREVLLSRIWLRLVGTGCRTDTEQLQHALCAWRAEPFLRWRLVTTLPLHLLLCEQLPLRRCAANGREPSSRRCRLCLLRAHG